MGGGLQQLQQWSGAAAAAVVNTGAQLWGAVSPVALWQRRQLQREVRRVGGLYAGVGPTSKSDGLGRLTW